jgi:hypothetical protein
VPNWREIDRNPRWHDWLLGIDALSGEVRQALLNAAISASDLNRVVGFFRAFQNQEGQAVDAGTSTALGAPLRRTRPPSGKPTYTRELIKQLYDQHRRGAYRGREAEWARQEADIIAAGREGRVEKYDWVGK